MEAQVARQRRRDNRNRIRMLFRQVESFLTKSILMMPLVTGMVFLSTLLVSLTVQVIFRLDAVADLMLWLFGHWDDQCSQPLGPLLKFFWIWLAVKYAGLTLWAKLNLEDGEENELFYCEWLKKFNWYILRPMVMALEMAWPWAVIVCLCLAKDCGKELVLNGWLLLLPCFVQVIFFSVKIVWPNAKPTLIRLGFLPDKGLQLLQTLQHVHFDAEAFKEDGGQYLSSCTVCLEEFSQADTDLVVAPCDSGKHVYHRECLLSWVRVAPTCPICAQRLRPSESRPSHPLVSARAGP